MATDHGFPAVGACRCRGKTPTSQGSWTSLRRNPEPRAHRPPVPEHLPPRPPPLNSVVADPGHFAEASDLWPRPALRSVRSRGQSRPGVQMQILRLVSSTRRIDRGTRRSARRPARHGVRRAALRVTPVATALLLPTASRRAGPAAAPLRRVHRRSQVRAVRRVSTTPRGRPRVLVTSRPGPGATRGRGG